MEQKTYQETVLPVFTATDTILTNSDQPIQTNDSLSILASTTENTTPSTIDAISWINPSRITAHDGSSATIEFMSDGDSGATIKGTNFSFRPLPDSAVIDGLAVTIKGSNSGCSGYVTLNIPGTTTTGQPISTLNKTYGGLGYFWGLDSLEASDLDGLEVTVSTDDISGGDGAASMDYMAVIVYWHIELEQEPNPSLPATFSYKVYSKDSTYLGDLPNVTSPFTFSQDINSAGAVLKTICGTSPKPTTDTEPILTNLGEPIQTNDSLSILASSTNTPLLPGESADPALFKNGNRLKVWMYNKWWPNGKLMFSGQMNRIDFSIGGSEEIAVTTYSDGMDLENYIARGYPFEYTPDQEQSLENGRSTMFRNPGEGGWSRYGQSFKTGSGVTNLGQISLKLLGTANVTVSLYDAPNGNFLGSASQSVVGATLGTPTDFNFPPLIPTTGLTDYFFGLDVGGGQSIDVARQTTHPYADGVEYESVSADGSGGDFTLTTYDLWFKTASGEPTTTTTYASQDPVTGMAAGIISDYNSRGGRVAARTLTAAGYDLTYMFNSSTVFGAIQKIIELCPSGYYAYIDLGLAAIDIMPTSGDADFTVVIGKDISSLDFSMTIERVKNQLLFSGGDTGGGVNLFKLYQDPESSGAFDTRLATKSDNRVTDEDTADAIGGSFIEENSGEIHETTVVLLNEAVDITQYLPGKTLSFRNTGMFTDGLVLQIVRRDFTKEAVKLTVGRLPVSQPAEIQRLNRQLLDQQTIGNPDQPD